MNASPFARLRFRRRVPDELPAVPRGLRVVVVVGHEAFAETLAASFREGGHEVVIAPDVPAAVGDPRVPAADVVVVGVDPRSPAAGWAVARHARDAAAWRKPFVVALTAGRDPESPRIADEAGVHLHLEAPVDLDRLRGLLVRFHALIADVEGFDPVI